MSYLNDKRRRLGGRELEQPVQVRSPATVQNQTTPVPKAVQTTAQRPQVQTQAAAPKVMEKQTQTQTAPATQPSAPAQAGGQDAVAAAQNLLSQQLGSYQSQYGGQIDSLIQQLQGQQPFTYDVNTDPLYLQLRDQWMRDGKMAMEDTMGQAAQLTGGYGNSYAQTAGQQVYNGYLQGLNEMVPQLKEAARADYDAENAYLMQQLGLLMDQDNQDYSRWMDELERQRYAEQLEYDRGRDALADQRYDQERQYQQGRDQLADQRYQDELAYGRGQDAYERLLEMIVTTGYKPTAGELAAAGMSESQAKAWLGYYQSQQAGSGSSGGSRGGSGGSGGSGGGDDGDNGGDMTIDQASLDDNQAIDSAIDLLVNFTGSDIDQPKKENYKTVSAKCAEYSGNGAPPSMIADYLKEALANGSITMTEYGSLMQLYGREPKKKAGGGSNAGGGSSVGGGSF